MRKARPEFVGVARGDCVTQKAKLEASVEFVVVEM